LDEKAPAFFPQKIGNYPFILLIPRMLFRLLEHAKAAADLNPAAALY